MRDAVQQAVEIVKQDPGVDNVMGFTGGQGATNSGFMFASLKPLNQRVSVEAIINRLRPKLARISGGLNPQHLPPSPPHPVEKAP